MAVHVKENANPSELYMIELQGTVTCSAGIFDSKHFGAITFNQRGNPELAIGTRILEGKIEKLKLPITALRKTDDWSTFRDCPELRTREVEIVGVIRSKLIFSARPRIISGA